MTTIFSIEDEEALVSLLEYNIQSAGYKFKHSPNGYDGMMKLQKSKPDLILLDWMLPDISFNFGSFSADFWLVFGQFLLPS